MADPVKKFTKKITGILDNFLKTGLYRKAAKLHDAWYASYFLNMCRRNINFGLTALRYRIGVHRAHKDTPLRLHLGCGERHLDGYVNIDFRKTCATDLVCDIRRLPYPSGSVAAIETYHVIEHLARHDFPKALGVWYQMLVVGGRLIIECPDFDGAVKEYVEGNEKRIDNIFGLQRFPGDAHQFGYNFERLREVLREAGFKEIERSEPLDYHAKDEPCLRVECVKG